MKEFFDAVLAFLNKYADANTTIVFFIGYILANIFLLLDRDKKFHRTERETKKRKKQMCEAFKRINEQRQWLLYGEPFWSLDEDVEF